MLWQLHMFPACAWISMGLAKTYVMFYNHLHHMLQSRVDCNQMQDRVLCSKFPFVDERCVRHHD